MNFKRGNIYYFKLPKISNESHIQSGMRPCLVVSNDFNNRFAPLLTVIPITTSLAKNKLPTHVSFSDADITGALTLRHSTFLCENIMQIDKDCIAQHATTTRISHELLCGVESAMRVQLGL